MDDFRIRDGRLMAEEVDLGTIAEHAGTPTYVYSRHTIVDHYRRLSEAWAEFAPRIHYAVKANGNLALLRVLVDEGAGFDVVSGGEIRRVLAAGGDPESIEFAGVGKRRDEIALALQAGIHGFTVESEAELEMIDRLAGERGQPARIMLRVNPDVDALTHPHISTGRGRDKFGMAPELAFRLARASRSMRGVRLYGLHSHIGSQMIAPGPFAQAVARLVEIGKQMRAQVPGLTTLDIGGGFGIHYRGDEAPAMDVFVTAAAPALRGAGFDVRLEPGRLLVGNAGVLLTRVLLLKDGGSRRFVVCDAAMNDLLRPSLYQAYHRIEPVAPRPGALEPVDVVGPVCETADTFAEQRPLPPLQAGDLLVLRSAGAYGFVMASNYNARPRPAEVLVNGARFAIVRARETYEDMVRGETAAPSWL